MTRWSSAARAKQFFLSVGRVLYRRRKSLLVGLGVFLALVIGAQLAYPSYRSLPFTSVAGDGASWQTREELAAAAVGQFADTKLELQPSGADTYRAKLSDVGGSPHVDEAIEALIDYPWWQRLIPFSLLAKQPRLDTIGVEFSDELLGTYTQQAAEKITSDPEDARLGFENDTLVVTEAKPGRSASAADIATSIRAAVYTLGTTTPVLVAAKETPAARSTASIEPVRAKAEAILSRKIEITLPGDKVVSPDKATRASWLQFKETDDGSLSLELDDAKLAEYTGSLNDTVKIPAGVTTVTKVDGVETARAVGKNGSALDQAQLQGDLKKIVDNTDQPLLVKTAMQPVAPTIKYDNSYTSSQKGLRAFAIDLATQRNVRIAVTQLGGDGWSAAARQTESTVSASTYKLFIALFIFDKVDHGELKWSDSVLDTDTAGCFERMIVQSNNACPEAWITKYGATTIQSFLYDKGFSRATSFTAADATRTSAADLQKLLVGLNNSSLISGDNRNRLLSAMSRQVYRNGIPAGTSGSVSDKVGFLWDYNHDAAIVSTARGSYILVVMTKGESFAAIADITRQLEKIMYP